MPTPQPRPAVNWRSVSLGLLGVVLICGLTPYNDYALNNTFLVGNNLPLGVMVMLFVFAVAINGPLCRRNSRHAFSSSEVAIAFSMTLVSCALPSSGLMRYLPPALVSPLYLAPSNREFLDLIEHLNLPAWIFPTFTGDSPRQWSIDPVVTDYYLRWTRGGMPPYLAWLKPALTWGVFLFALYTALMCMVVLVRRQWFENERLAFPLAQIQLALVEQPAAGNWLNQIMRPRSFWFAFAAIFLLHGWNGLSRYFPQFVPEIWVWYDLGKHFTEEPWTYLDHKITNAAVFFTVVGVTYFISSTVAFSLWFFFILHQLYRIWLGAYAGDPEAYGQHDQHFGGVVAYALAVLWIGRRHWRLILAQTFRGERADEPRGRYLPYPFAFWGLIGATIVMIAWLVLAGATLLGASVMILLLLLLFFMITRIIAETGLVHGQLQVPIYKPWTHLALLAKTQGLTSLAHPVTLKTFYLGSLLQSVHYDFREVLPVYASHGLKVSDQTVFSERSTAGDEKADRITGRKIIAALALALLVGYGVSFASTLWTEYRYAATQDAWPRVPINDWGVDGNPRSAVIGATMQYAKSNYSTRHNPAGHMTFGFAFTTLLSFLRLRYAWWPLHPIGYLMLETYPTEHLWLSIFIGWTAKLMLLRFGGPKGYVNAKPFFLGIIIGESAAAAFWLSLGMLLSGLGLPYRPVNIMPG